MAFALIGWLRPELMPAVSKKPWAFNAVFMGGLWLLLLSLPRSWQQQMEEDYALLAYRRLNGEFIVCIISFIAMVLLSRMLLRSDLATSPMSRSSAAILPLLPTAAMLVSYVRYLRGIDELKRRIELDSIAIATLLTCLLYLAGGLQQVAKVIAINSASAMLLVFPLIAMAYSVSHFFLLRHYR